MNSLDNDAIISKANSFLHGLARYTRDREISNRLPEAVTNAVRLVGYKIVNEPKMLEDPKLLEEIERHTLSEFIGQRILDRARDKQEPIHLAERISRGFFNELKSLSKDFYKAKLFIEAFCMLHEIEKKGLP